MSKEQDLFADDIVSGVIEQDTALDNNNTSQNKQDEVVIDTNLAENIDKLAISFQKAGIEIKRTDNRKDIVDYSKFMSDLNQYFIQQRNTCEGLMKQYETTDGRVVSNVKIINDNNEKIKELFNLVLTFFTNPPSKEFLDLTNYSALFQKLYVDYKAFSEQAASLKLEEMAKEHKETFEKHIEAVENFEVKIDTKLEHVASKYKNFTENMLKTLNEQLVGIQSQINTYQGIREKYEKTTKSLTRGLYALISLCSVLCVGAGALLGYGIFSLFH